MDWLNIIIPGITGILGIGLGGTLLKFLIFPQITKKAEQAGADSSWLANLEKVQDLQGNALLKATEEKIALAEENSKLLTDNYNLKSKISEYDYEISEIKRVQAGILKSQNTFFGQLKFAQKHICLKQPCEDRIPELGTYIDKEHENESM